MVSRGTHHLQRIHHAVAGIKSIVYGWEDRLEHLLRHGFFALLHLPLPTLLDLSDLLRRKSDESDRLRRVIVEAVDNVTARAFWKEDFDKYDKAAFDPPKHKLSKLLVSGTASLMLSQPESRIDLRQIMDTGQALLVDLVNPADWATQRMLVEELVSCLGPSLPAHLADRTLDSLVSAYGELLRLFLQTQGFLGASHPPTETPFSFPPLYG